MESDAHGTGDDETQRVEPGTSEAGDGLATQPTEREAAPEPLLESGPRCNAPSPQPQQSQPLGITSQNSSSESQPNVSRSHSDRVFPIRSVISVDTSQTPASRHKPDEPSSAVHRDGYFPSLPTPTRGIADHGSENEEAAEPENFVHSWIPTRGLGTEMSMLDGSESEPAIASNSESAITDGRARAQSSVSNTGHVTARFKHVVTAEGHAIITGRDGDVLQKCEDEPIHIPGAVQGFGLLIALEEVDEEQLLVRVVSENSERLMGYTPQQLFELHSFSDILSAEQTDNFLDHLDFIQDDDMDPATNGPEVFTITVRSPKEVRKSTKFWCAMHINPAHPNLIICEFELDDDILYPLAPSSADTPELPEDTLSSNPTESELLESTVNSSRPLRVLRTARRRKGEAAAMEVFNIMSQVQEQLASATTLDTFLKILVGVVKELTGFHRVMIYQFDSNFNGRVVTELVDPRATRDLYQGLNFPASDIPKQARDLYKINKVRLLYDRDLESARLVCRTIEDLQTPLDLTYSYLRAMSPIHIKYLANMAVRSSMSISINAFDELWGLISCHAYGAKGTRVSFPIRKMCRLVGDTASRNIERLSYASRLQARKLINTAPTGKNPSGYIVATSGDLLKLFDADFGLLSIHGETKILGHLEQSQEALALLEYLRLSKIKSVFTSQDIITDLPDLRYPPGFNVIAGLLLVPLTVSGNDFIVFFRKGQIKEVKWAGNPYEKFVKEGTEGYLEPRKSFRVWRETVLGKSREWTEEQVETAAVLCLVYGKFIEVWRLKEVAVGKSQLTRLLLANSAHEVRTPLNAIINYLELALEGPLDQDTRENLTTSYSASKSLIYVINDLLDLTKTEQGLDLIKDEEFDLPATIREAYDIFKGDAKRKTLDYQFIQNPGLPQYVYGDQRKVRQAIFNIVANAVQNTVSGWIKIEASLQDVSDTKATVEIIVQDSGVGMSIEKLDALFRALEQVSPDSESFDDSKDLDLLVKKDESRSKNLGLGLAIVARTVRNMDGQLRLKSIEGQGSRFTIQLPFFLSGGNSPAEEESLKLSVTASSQPPIEGEVTLVDKASSRRSEGVVHRRSNENIGTRSLSVKSGSSSKSAKSDVDRLIAAISSGQNLSGQEDDEQNPTRLSRQNSKSSKPSHSSVLRTPNTPNRPSSFRDFNPPDHIRDLDQGSLGSEFVEGNKTLLRAVRLTSDEFPDPPPTHSSSKVVFDVHKDDDDSQERRIRFKNGKHLQILVAEDDPINSKILQKRLEKAGHDVFPTINGEDCATAYSDGPTLYDVVLMDIQMPIMDGIKATKTIRSFEKSHFSEFSARAAHINKIPIFAVSASLVEREMQSYIDTGFDGWILKPVDFKRLYELLAGTVADDKRLECLYKPGQWERGGWFQNESALESDVPGQDDTTPKNEASIPAEHEPVAGKDESIVESADVPQSATSEQTKNEVVSTAGPDTNNNLVGIGAPSALSEEYEVKITENITSDVQKPTIEETRTADI